MTGEEKAIIKEWETARRSWWLYSPAKLKQLERQASEIYAKYGEEVK